MSRFPPLGLRRPSDIRPSDSVNTVSGALRELSERVQKEGRPKVVVKIMYDRGSWEQLWNAHSPVKANVYTKLDLPDPKDVPGLHLQVVVSFPAARCADSRTFTRYCSARSMSNS